MPPELQLRTCPEEPRIRHLVAGRIGEAESLRLEEHMLTCPTCAAIHDAELEHVAAIVGTGHSSQIDEPDRRAIDRLMNRLVELIPVSSKGDTIPDVQSEMPTLPPSAPPDRGASVPEAAQAVDDTTAESSRWTEEALRKNFGPPRQAGDLGTLGRYRILEKLGHGGMGAVFKAHDTHLDRNVAIKLILPTDKQREADRTARFLREARAVASLRHDNVVQIHECAEHEGIPYQVMPLLKGVTLAKRLKRDPRLDLAFILRVTREIASGLAAAHAAGLVHRDLKPDNIFLEDTDDGPQVRILDFGLACWQDGSENLSDVGMLIGTPHFMAPEQVRSDPIDSRTDLWALGCILYLLSTGKLPFNGANQLALIRAVELHEPTTPASLDQAIPPRLSDLTMRCLAKRVEDRPASAKEMVELLKNIAAEDDSSSPTRSGIDRTLPEKTKGPFRSRTAHNLARIAVLSIVLAVVIIIKNRDGKEDKIIAPNGSTVTLNPDGSVFVQPPPSDKPDGPAKGKSTLPRTADDAFRIALEKSESGQFDAGMHYYARALQLGVADRDRSEAIRRSLHALLPDVRKPVMEFEHSQAVTQVAFSPDGNRILTGCLDGTARLWDVRGSKQLIKTFGNPKKKELPPAIISVAFHPNGRWIVTGGQTFDVRFWDIETGRETVDSPFLADKFVGLRGEITSLSFSSDKKSLLVTWYLPERGRGGHCLLRWNGDRYSAEKPEPISGGISQGTFVPDGTRYMVGTSNGTLDWDPQARQDKMLVQGKNISGISVAAQANRALFGINLLDNELKRGGQAAVLWNLATMTEEHLFRVGDNECANACAFSTDGSTIAIAINPAGGFQNARVQLYDGKSFDPIGPPLVFNTWSHSVSFAPDGKTYAVSVGGDNPSCRIYTSPRRIGGEADRIVKWVQSVTGSELSSDGTIQKITDDARKKLQDETRDLLPR